ncbi:MAG: hypothetical protein Q9187_001727 [Circinaria calcarea]
MLKRDAYAEAYAEGYADAYEGILAERDAELDWNFQDLVIRSNGLATRGLHVSGVPDACAQCLYNALLSGGHIKGESDLSPPKKLSSSVYSQLEGAMAFQCLHARRHRKRVTLLLEALLAKALLNEEVLLNEALLPEDPAQEEVEKNAS